MGVGVWGFGGFGVLGSGGWVLGLRVKGLGFRGTS